MEHRKRLQLEQLALDASRGLIIEGPVPPDRLTRMTMHKALDAFRRPHEQHDALVEIAGLDEGRIILVREGDMIVGYVTFHYADELERWLKHWSSLSPFELPTKWLDDPTDIEPIPRRAEITDKNRVIQSIVIQDL